MIEEVVGLQQEEYMYESCQDNKYFLMNLDNEARTTTRLPKFGFLKSCPKKGGDK